MNEVLNPYRLRPQSSSTSAYSGLLSDATGVYCASISNLNPSAIIKMSLLNTSSEHVTFHYLSEELTANLDRLNSFRGLKSGWNGYDAEPLSDKIIDKVIGVVSGLKYQPTIFPTGRASIQLEYHKGEDYLEFEIYEENVGMLMIVNGEETERDNIDISEISELINAFNANS